jgi:hypothetical protein
MMARPSVESTALSSLLPARATCTSTTLGMPLTLKRLLSLSLRAVSAYGTARKPAGMPPKYELKVCSSRSDDTYTTCGGGAVERSSNRASDHRAGTARGAAQGGGKVSE